MKGFVYVSITVNILSVFLRLWSDKFQKYTSGRKKSWSRIHCTIVVIITLHFFSFKMKLHKIRRKFYIKWHYIALSFYKMCIFHCCMVDGGIAEQLKIHYSDVIMSVMASQITGVSIVCSTICSDTDLRKHQSSASLAFVMGIHWWPVDSPHKGQ